MTGAVGARDARFAVEEPVAVDGGEGDRVGLGANRDDVCDNYDPEKAAHYAIVLFYDPSSVKHVRTEASLLCIRWDTREPPS